MARDGAGGGPRAATDAEARALASSVRLRILRLCTEQELTNKQVADLLGIDPGSALHHIRTLTGTGFLAPQPERRGRRGARERPYRTTGKAWTLDVPTSRAATTAGISAFLAEVAEVDAAAVLWQRATLRLTPQDVQALEADLRALVERYQADPRPEGDPYALFAVTYPRTTPPAGAAG
jgi:predicted ArsR family transcriptional regulator